MGSNNTFERDISTQRHGTTIALDLDVFSNILSFLPIADLLSIAYTSRLLQELAYREALTRPICLERHQQLQSFCLFMVAGHPSLFPFVHSLSLQRMPAIPPLLMTLLIEVIYRATRLRELRIIWLDDSFVTDPRFVEAICALPTLHRLHLTGLRAVDKSIAHVVLNMRSSLKVLEIPDRPENDFGDEFPEQLAAHHRELEELHICFPTLSNMRWVPFSAIRKLTLTIGDGVVSLPHLATILPHLKELSLDASGYQPLPTIQQIRHEAKKFQSAGHGWKSLDRLTGTIWDLYTLCPTCPVKRVHFGHYSRHSHPESVDVIAGTRPQRIDMSLHSGPYDQPEESDQSLFLFETGTGTPGAVSHLVARLSCSFYDPPTNQQIMDILTPLLRCSRLEYIHLALAESFASTEIDETIFHPYTITPRSVKNFADIDVPFLVASIASCVTSLRVIVLTIATRDQSVWVVDSKGAVPRTNRLDPRAGRELMIREERKYLENDIAFSSG